LALTLARVPDAIFEHPRLAAVYDALDPDRGDLDAYADIARELDAHRVVDVGCGTGTLALLLAQRGVEVIGLDPANASLEVARAKPGADHVRWIHGDATACIVVAASRFRPPGGGPSRRLWR
jgi:ubiquinone/menaquinone biosynthesis C-methylase UbiE